MSEDLNPEAKLRRTLLSLSCCFSGGKHVYGCPIKDAFLALQEVEAELDRLRAREPTWDEMERALGENDEAFLGGTIRRCLDCRGPVFGGPTRCAGCARLKYAQTEEAVRLENETLPEKLARIWSAWKRWASLTS